MVKPKRFNQNMPGCKGQSLVEVAVFGSLLLLALGYLVRWGLTWSYQQEVKMDAFRRSLKAASESPVPKEHNIAVFKDIRFPDPEDMFGLGQRDRTKWQSGVVWSNNSSGLDYSTREQTPTVTYVFDPDNNYEYGFFPNEAWIYGGGTGNINRTYTTSALDPRPGSIVQGRPLILKGIPQPWYAADSRVYQEQEGFGPKEVMILLQASNCLVDYCNKTILDSVRYTTPRGGDRYYPVFNVTGNVGSPPAQISFVNSEAGEINTTLGAMQTVSMYINKHRELNLTENANMYRSRETLNDGEAINHTILIGPNYEHDGPTIIFRNQAAPTWTTTK